MLLEAPAQSKSYSKATLSPSGFVLSPEYEGEPGSLSTTTSTTTNPAKQRITASNQYQQAQWTVDSDHTDRTNRRS